MWEVIFMNQSKEYNEIEKDIIQKISALPLESKKEFYNRFIEFLIQISLLEKEHNLFFDVKETWKKFAKLISECIQNLPQDFKKRLLDDLNSLEKRHFKSVQEEISKWSEFSLISAMRDMEDEPDIYTEEDLQERLK